MANITSLTAETSPVSTALAYIANSPFGATDDRKVTLANLAKAFGVVGKVTVTQPATSAVLTIADGKTLTASNTLTFIGTDGSSLDIGTGGTLGTAAYTASTSYAAALSGTINEIAYFNSATTIASLAVVTYPSLTELSYVKGVTSAIQTQLGNKLSTTLASANIFVGNGSNIATAVALSGDASLSNAGVLGVNKTRLNVRNETGSTIVSTRVVYVSGFNNFPLITLADNTDEAKHGVVGVTIAPLTHESNGFIATDGQFDAETNSWTVGTILYLSTAGALTSTQPTSGAVKIIGTVTVQANYPTGKILLTERQEENILAGGASTDVILRTGDAIGVNKFSFRDYANAEVAFIDSNGVINSTTLTASEILITDASKNIVSAPVATYPSLTELSYVKGLSSAIQTQLGGKAALAGATFTGAVAVEHASGLTLGKDETGGTPNIAGTLKLISVGDNAFYNTFTSGTNTANATYTLPTAMPAVSGYALTCTDAGVMSWTAASGFAWNATATGSSGIGLSLSATSGATGAYAFDVANSSTAPTNAWIYGVLGNTQAAAHTMFKLNSGTSVQNHVLQELSVLKGYGVRLNFYGGATQAVGNTYNIYGGNNFNTNSSFGSYGFYWTNAAQAGAGENTGIYISNAETAPADITSSSGVAIGIAQSGVDGTSLQIRGGNNVNCSTNGLVNYSISNTQSGATVMQKIDTGTSAQAHTGLLVNLYNASSSARGIKADLGSAGTGYGIEVSSASLAGSSRHISSLHLVSGSLTSSSAIKNYFAYSRTNTATTGTVSDTYNGTYFLRESTQNGAGGTFNASGSVVFIENSVTQTAGTLTDTVAVLSLVQDNDSTGGHILFNTYTGVPTTDGTLYFDGTNFKYRAGGATKTITAV